MNESEINEQIQFLDFLLVYPELMREKVKERIKMLKIRRDASSTESVINSPQENDDREANVSNKRDLRVAPRENSESMQSSAKDSGDIHQENKRLLDKDYVKTNESVGGRK